MTVLVKPIIYLVPGGMEQGRCRATLIVTPCPSGTGFELNKWPSSVASWIKRALPKRPAAPVGFAIRCAPYSAPAEVRDCSGIEHRVHAVSEVDWRAIDALWQQCFQNVKLGEIGAGEVKKGDENTVWAVLSQILENSTSVNAGAAAALKGGCERTVGSDDALVDPDNIDFDGAILTKPNAAGSKKSVVGVVPIASGSLSIDEERERALRVSRVAAFGPHSMDDAREHVDDSNPTETRLDSEGAFQAAVKDVLVKQIQSDVAATDGARKGSADAFKYALSWLSGDGDLSSLPSCVISADFNPIPCRADRSPCERRAFRASYAYGTLAQRRKDDSWTPDPESKGIGNSGDRHLPRVSPPDIAQRVNSVSASEKVGGLLYHLQNDPKLSRLFCFCVDIAFDPPSFAPLDVPGMLVEVRADDAHERSTEVRTAASFSSDSFWPLSAFAVTDHGDKLAQSAMVEQIDGVWNLGMKDPGCTADRYDLSCLDVHRALETKLQIVDRGERHRSAGMFIIDRGRGLQIARELAIKCHQVEQETLILFAESLTVGRRVDVACVEPCERFSEKTPWRGLYQRWVDYSFDSNISPSQGLKLQQALRDLIEPNHTGRLCFKDEGVHQVSARQMPNMTGNAEHVEAVPDECILLWNGLPSAGAGDRPAKPQEGIALPIHARRHLRALEDKDRRLPPPLRYGRSYVFGMRSVFRGGVSQDVERMAQYHATTLGQNLLPRAREDGAARPRRFLRHDGIPAPTLLMPADIARRKIKQLGYEPLDQAIVRSTYMGEEKLLDRSAHAPPYIGLDGRTGPDETLRVFLPPECTPDEVRRHGCLDGADKGTIALGGLKSIGFIRRKLDNCDTPLAQGNGFPAATMRRIPSLLGEDVYERQISSSSSDGGIALFDVGGQHTVEEYGWLPDPAVSRYSVRVRVRGSDRYLSGDLNAALYDEATKIRYPNALPLVVRVQRSGGRRAAACTAASELVAGKRSEVPLGNYRGVSVRELILVLFEAEDFDLEVACLPTEDALAALFSLPETIAQQRAHAAGDESAARVLEKCSGTLNLAACATTDTSWWCGLGNYLVPPKGFVKGVAAELLAVMARQWPIEELAAVTRLRICHAINRPPLDAEAPRLLDLFASRPSLPEAADYDVSASTKGRSTEQAAATCKLASDADVPDGDGKSERSGAMSFLLSGKLELDLDAFDAFELFADATAVSGQPIDDPARSRSLISRRTGRWPIRGANETGGQPDYVSPEEIYGFSVAADGRVTLRKEHVRLLRVENLPQQRAMGDVVKVYDNDDVKVKKSRKSGGDLKPYLGDDSVRPATLDLSFFHSAARSGARIHVSIARPERSEDAGDDENSATPVRVRLIKSVLLHDFSDTKARLLKVGVRALSRFAELFETAPQYVDGVESPLRRRQALDETQQSVIGNYATVCIPSSARPAPCEPKRPEPSFLHRCETTTPCGATQHTVTRRVLTRLHLGRGWFSSGEGERLGIVLWPPNYFDGRHALDCDRVHLHGRDMSIADFEDDDLGPGGAFVSRCGGDPVRKDAYPQRRVFINPSDFGDRDPQPQPDCWRSPHDPKLEPCVMMPVRKRDAASDADNKNAIDSFLEVTLLTYVPHFDLEREEWYVDIDLRPRAPSEPIIRLGLVRYQPNSIDANIALSFPVTVMAPLLPERTLQVSLSESADNLAIQMLGRGSNDIKDLRPKELLAAHVTDAKTLQRAADEFDNMRRPILRLALFHESRDPETATLNRIPIDFDEKTGEYPAIPLSDGYLCWKATRPLSSREVGKYGEGQLVLYAEEIERRLPAKFPHEPIAPEEQFIYRPDAKKPDEAFQSPIYSGPRFSARVEIMRVGKQGRLVNGPADECAVSSGKAGT